MCSDWTDRLVAYLHEPPDKALCGGEHEIRACRYASVAAGREVTLEELRGVKTQLAAHLERLPMPPEAENAQRSLGPENGCLKIVHPLSGKMEMDQLKVDPAESSSSRIEAVIGDLVRDYPGPKQRFLALWRLLPERLAEQAPYYGLLPADPRVPDHTIWHYLDTAAGLKAALRQGDEAALLSFTLDPVQVFIEAARSVRDLWSGSMLLSWLTFQGMLPVVEEYGPAAILFPCLRGLPLIDRWLRGKGVDKVPAPCAESAQSPCLPNRFLAVVARESNGKKAEALGEECRKAVQEAWGKLAERVRAKIDSQLKQNTSGYSDWAKLWQQQIEGFFSVTTTVLPLNEWSDETVAELLGAESFAQAFPEAKAVRVLAEAIGAADRPPDGARTSAGRWRAQWELANRLLEASRAVRHIPPSTQQTPVPGKCSLMGTFEQMGPAELKQSSDFWEAMAKHIKIGLDRIRKRERFCAVALTKRFAPHFLAAELGIDENELRTHDTATVAAAKWLARARKLGYPLDPDMIRRRHGVWSGQWLFWTKQDPEEDEDEEKVPDEVWKVIEQLREHDKHAGKDKQLGPPPAYYAIVLMDGDHMGSWLSGERLPQVEEVLHPEILKCFKEADAPGVGQSLKVSRPLVPASHAAISEALTNFVLYVVPRIVKQHHGTLIYAGGDDVLAMLPTAEAVACARELRLAFSGDRRCNQGAREGYYRVEERELLMMGPQATASCGVAVVHHKEDLRFALQQARRAERAAKEAGRDALQIVVCRRSGEHTSVLCPWEFADTVERWVQAFVGPDGASDRWAYRLYSERETLGGLPQEAFCALLSREVNRAEERTKQKLGATRDKAAGQKLVEAFGEYLSQLRRPRTLSQAEAVENFVLLCQTASFLARGRTE